MATKSKQTTEAGEVRQPMPEPEGGWPADEYTGQAGTFIRDPFTGRRYPEGNPPADPEQPTAD
ncbi:MAG: hypothetical protein JNK17_02110 [Hydrogenophaga sp.]|nr:hypothetical protein [Hydrogenophaga sp.]